MIRWGIIGCGDVTEVKSGPGFQQAEGSALVAVMRRDGDKSRDYARRHHVPRAYDRADDLCVPGFVNTAQTLATKLLPRRLVGWGALRAMQRMGRTGKRPA